MISFIFQLHSFYSRLRILNLKQTHFQMSYFFILKVCQIINDTDKFDDCCIYYMFFNKMNMKFEVIKIIKLNIQGFIKFNSLNNQFYLMSYSSIIRELEASRRLSSDLAIERHHQELERVKVQKQLESLRRSRKNYIEGQIAQSKLQYEEKLRQDTEVSQQHLNRKKRAAAEKAKMAQQDFERQRQRLLEERNNHDNLDKQYRIIDRNLLDVQTKSRVAQEDEEKKLFQLTTRKNTILRLLQQSRQRQAFHLTQAKRFSAL